jgi:putative transposase
VNSEFVVEIAAGDGEPGRQVGDLAEMNRLFTAWVETVYHRQGSGVFRTCPGLCSMRWQGGICAGCRHGHAA